MRAELDHIVVIAATLAAGLDHVEAAIGVRLPPGGKHPLMATHNHLVRLGGSTFLEVIAPDPDAQAPGRARWFGLDQPPQVPRLAHWVIRTKDINATLTRLNMVPSDAIVVTRGDLSWRLTVAQDGQLPMRGGFPSVIEWDGDDLPPERMPTAGLELVSLEITNPDAIAISNRLAPVFSDERVTFRNGAPRMSARIMTPDGIGVLG